MCAAVVLRPPHISTFYYLLFRGHSLFWSLIACCLLVCIYTYMERERPQNDRHV